VKDPVCGMSVEPEEAAGKTEHKGETYYFCSEKCLQKFEKEPTAYPDKKKSEKKAVNFSVVEKF